MLTRSLLPYPGPNVALTFLPFVMFAAGLHPTSSCLVTQAYPRFLGDLPVREWSWRFKRLVVPVGRGRTSLHQIHTDTEAGFRGRSLVAMPAEVFTQIYTHTHSGSRSFVPSWRRGTITRELLVHARSRVPTTPVLADRWVELPESNQHGNEATPQRLGLRCTYDLGLAAHTCVYAKVLYVEAPRDENPSSQR